MQNQLENKVYAGFFVRFIAYAIDSMIAALIVGIVKLPFSIAAGGVSFLKANFIFNYSLLDVFTYIGIAAYFVLLTYFAHSTPGKLLFRLQVVTKDGEWTFINILYRETVGRFLSSLLCIGYLAVLVTKQKQGFHDMLCDTCVVYRDMAPVLKERPVVAVAGSSGQEMDFGISEKEDASKVNTPVYYSKESAPVYHSASAFELPESHPISAEPVQELKEEISSDSDNTDSDNMNG